MQRFRLAPMNGVLLWITILVLPLPLLIGFAGSAAGTGALWIVAAFLGAIYLSVWLYMRPKAFEITADSFDIVWPTRRQSTPRSAITDVETLTWSEFREKYGLGYRIGAGGLFGGFGLYKTRSVTFQFYVSRTDRFVVLGRVDDRPLMITPENPDRLVETLRVGSDG